MEQSCETLLPMLPVTPLVWRSVFCALVCGFAATAFAIPEDWKDKQGTKFFGEPTELLGPFVVFRTSRDTGHRVALQLLTPRDCVRVNQALQDKPARAPKWSDAKGEATRELINRVVRVEAGRVVPADLATRPEPAAIVVFYVSNAESESRDMLKGAMEPFKKLQKDFPGMVEGVMYGFDHTKSDHISMAESLQVPWLLTDFYEQGSLDSLNRFLPESSFIMVLSREGVPLFTLTNSTAEEVVRLFSDLSGLLELTRSDNPKGWSALGYYWSVVQPVKYATGKADPLLVGNPLAAPGLVQRKVLRFDADIKVRADGQVTDVKVMPNPQLPETMAGPIADGLKKAVFVPAVRDGTFVDGVYRYQFRAP